MLTCAILCANLAALRALSRKLCHRRFQRPDHPETRAALGLAALALAWLHCAKTITPPQ